MDTRFLESLISVVETGSIAAAARAQGLTAAAVSQRIRTLEAELGCLLLSRAAHSAAPTGDCLRLLPAARALVRDAQKLKMHVTADGLQGPYRLGAVSTALLDCVPKIVEGFREEAPKAELNVQPGTSAALYDDLVEGKLDAAITVKPPFDLPKRIRCEELEGQAIVHIAPRRKSRSDKTNVEVPWILYDRQSWGGRQIWEAFRSRVTGPVLCELDALETILLMVAQGSGQALIPMWGGVSERREQLKITRLGGENGIVRELVFLKHSSSVSAAIDSLVMAKLQSH